MGRFSSGSIDGKWIDAEVRPVGAGARMTKVFTWFRIIPTVAAVLFAFTFVWAMFWSLTTSYAIGFVAATLVSMYLIGRYNEYIMNWWKRQWS